MPTFVRPDACDGCTGLDRAACVYICPHDLMKLDTDGSETGWAMKAWNQEPQQCWACYACVKACPRQAIGLRAAADVVPMGGRVRPEPGAETIVWSVQFRNGDENRFEYPIRTRPADAIESDSTHLGGLEPGADTPMADLERIGEPGFFNLSALPNPGDPAELIRK